jgi:hypothetical protein
VPAAAHPAALNPLAGGSIWTPGQMELICGCRIRPGCSDSHGFRWLPTDHVRAKDHDDDATRLKLLCSFDVGGQNLGDIPIDRVTLEHAEPCGCCRRELDAPRLGLWHPSAPRPGDPPVQGIAQALPQREKRWTGKRLTSYENHNKSRSGGIGRRGGFKSPCATEEAVAGASGALASTDVALDSALAFALREAVLAREWAAVTELARAVASRGGSR